ncbi:MAG: amidohydrolase [Nitrososphaerota archaeon]|nr:amidohydrolase [Nitrososphaerota archaeon]
MKVLFERCSFWPEGSGSVFVVDGRIERVSSSETQPVPSDAARLDASWGTLLPGLVDSHCHPFELGWLRRNVDLRGTSNITALRMRVSARAQRTPPGAWIAGMGWDHEAFAERRLPSRSDIDDVSQGRPVILGRVCGHIGLLNSRAIEALGLEPARGEEYDRDAEGRLTGIVREQALVDAYSKMPRDSASDCMADLSAVEFEAARCGLNCLHNVVSPDGYKEELEALTQLARNGRLMLRHRVYVPPDAIGGIKAANEKLKSTRARINGVKLFADGSLGARTAALREPYSDDPGNSGLLRYEEEELSALAASADEEGLQVIIHAIGDRAVEQAIGALAAVSGSRNPRGHRIEHASVLPRDLRARVKKHSIRLAVQPSFIASDTWAERRLGSERVRDLYPLNSILSEGIVASGGSDAPVESLSPILGVWAAMAGRPAQSPESLTLDKALQIYTRNAASNGLDEPVVLKEGSQADLTLLDSDIRGMHPALLRKVTAAATVVAGELVYSSFE